MCSLVVYVIARGSFALKVLAKEMQVLESRILCAKGAILS